MVACTEHLFMEGYCGLGRSRGCVDQVLALKNLCKQNLELIACGNYRRRESVR